MPKSFYHCRMKNDLLLRTIRGDQVERPPVWLMRQAGRILPQYREVRSAIGSFRGLVKRPDLVAEVTIQPVDELGVDAAIIFSDILVIPEAMGLEYELIEKKGPNFPKTIKTGADVEALLAGDAAAENLQYVYDGIDQTLAGLDGRVPLIGFAGAPWTLLAYMVEGKGSKTFSEAKKFLYKEPALAHKLLEKITDSIISYLKLKIKHGVSVVQVFDSWASSLSPAQYATFSFPYIQKICNAINEVPVVVFAKGAWFAMESFKTLNCEVIGLDWNTSITFARDILGDEIILQGNLDPCQLYATKADIEKATLNLIEEAGRRHIINLGHGVYPDTPLEGVKYFVNTVKSYNY